MGGGLFYFLSAVAAGLGNVEQHRDVLELPLAASALAGEGLLLFFNSFFFLFSLFPLLFSPLFRRFFFRLISGMFQHLEQDLAASSNTATCWSGRWQAPPLQVGHLQVGHLCGDSGSCAVSSVQRASACRWLHGPVVRRHVT